MSTDSDQLSPREAAATLPQFRQPPAPAPNRISPEVDPADHPTPTRYPRPDDDETPRPGRDATRTGTSSRASKPHQAEVAGLVVGLLMIVVAGAAWAVRARTGRRYQLRAPTDEQADRIAAPLARLALRHVPVDLLEPSLLDLITAGAAVGRYVNDGDLLVPTPADALPDLQEDS